MSKTTQERIDDLLRQVGIRIKKRREELRLSRKEVGGLFNPEISGADWEAVEDGTEDLPLSEFIRTCIFLRIAPSKVLQRITQGKGHRKGEAHHSCKLSEDNVRSIRPGYGLRPKYMKNILGKAAKKNIKKGTKSKLQQ